MIDTEVRIGFFLEGQDSSFFNMDGPVPLPKPGEKITLQQRNYNDEIWDVTEFKAPFEVVDVDKYYRVAYPNSDNTELIHQICHVTVTVKEVQP